MPDTTPNLSMPLILPAQAQKHVTHNEALQLLDTLVQLVLQSRTLTTPPVSPTTGQSYGVPLGASGAWASYDGSIAVFLNGGWVHITPQEGWQAYVIDEAAMLTHDASSWKSHAEIFDRVAGLGINTTADTTNRLSVASEASLLNNAGAGHQLKINKALATDTASLLFQTGFSGRAEIGTTGSDQLAFKVSADGSTWIEPLKFNSTTGAAAGAAVQQSRTDVTAGRLMRADYGYGPGNLLGAVSQSAGVPQGAVIERGTNANGDYTRFADGTQICWATLSVGSVIAAGAGTWISPYRSSPDVTWTFPAAFSTTPMVMGRAIPPTTASSSADRRRAVASVGRANTLAMYQINVTRIGSVVDADIFEVGMMATGRWF
jgi:hypothetical protein